MITIQQISSQDTFPVRQPLLRPGLPRQACIFEGDDLPTTTHLGLYIDNVLTGIVSVFKCSSDKFPSDSQYQLRGMAVLPHSQKQGLGEKMVEAAEKLIKESSGDLIWFNARESAVGFYQKLGYTITGERFDIAGVGPHYIMYKALT